MKKRARSFVLLGLAAAVLSLGSAIALAGPTLIDNCPVPWTNVSDNNHIDKIYGAKGTSNDYCHCFIAQATEQCKLFHNPFCGSWAINAGISAFSPTSLCDAQLAHMRKDPNFTTYRNNCISDTTFYKKAC